MYTKIENHHHHYIFIFIFFVDPGGRGSSLAPLSRPPDGPLRPPFSRPSLWQRHPVLRKPFFSKKRFFLLFQKNLEKTSRKTKKRQKQRWVRPPPNPLNQVGVPQLVHLQTAKVYHPIYFRRRRSQVNMESDIAKWLCVR